MQLRVLALSGTANAIALFVVTQTAAQNSAAETELVPPIFVPRPATANRSAADKAPARSSARPSPMSAQMSANIRSVIEADTRLKAASGSEASNATRPQNSGEITRLAPFVVREKPVPEFSQREMLTVKGKIDLAKKRYPAAGSAGLMLLEQDFAIERRREMADLEALRDFEPLEAPATKKREVKKKTKSPTK
jgi:hypothetical protein